MQQGGGSKDTWVLADQPGQHLQPAAPAAPPGPAEPRRRRPPSRHADNFYWLGRYVERAESVVRLLRGILVRLTEKSGMAEVPELPVLLAGAHRADPDLSRVPRPDPARLARASPRASCSR